MKRDVIRFRLHPSRLAKFTICPPAAGWVLAKADEPLMPIKTEFQSYLRVFFFLFFSFFFFSFFCFGFCVRSDTWRARFRSAGSGSVYRSTIRFTSWSISDNVGACVVEWVTVVHFLYGLFKRLETTRTKSNGRTEMKRKIVHTSSEKMLPNKSQKKPFKM